MIFYLSCTGNTKWVAESIAGPLDERMVDVAEAVGGSCTYSIEEGEVLGFCFPVHGWRPPRVLLDFIGRLVIDSGAALRPYTFAVCTEGDTVGQAMDIFVSACAGRGIQIDMSRDVMMPNTYVGLPFMDVDGKKLENRKLRDAKERVEGICNDIHAPEGQFDRTYRQLAENQFAVSRRIFCQASCHRQAFPCGCLPLCGVWQMCLRMPRGQYRGRYRLRTGVASQQ